MVKTLKMREWGEKMRQQYQGPLCATDIIIEYEHQSKLGIVLISRVFPPYGLAIPGGMAEPEVSLEDNAIKEAKEETGLDVVLTNPEQPLCVHSQPGRDPRAHIASITYIAQGYGTLKAGDDAKTAHHYSLAELEELVKYGEFAFGSHRRALGAYLQYRNHQGNP